MKYKLFIIVLLPLLFIGCHNKSQQSAETNETTSEQNISGNPYISDKQAEETPIQEEDLSGRVISLSGEEFINRITEVENVQGFQYKGLTPCMVDFYADWCGPCLSIKPMVEELAKKYKGKVIIYKVNVDHAREVCEQLDINSIPTLMFFKRNEQPKKMVGAPSKGELDKALNELTK